LRLLDCVFFYERLSILPDHTHFFPAETCVVDRHAEESVFIVLVIGGKGVLVKQHQFCFIRARFREVGKILPNRSDQA
jgi:hypothetical protein